MALLRGKLLAGALFAGLLFGPSPAEEVVAATQQAGLFKPIRAAAPHEVSLRALARWNVKLPDPVVRVVIPASSQYVSVVPVVLRGTVSEPNTGLVTPAVYERTFARETAAHPSAGGNSEFLRHVVFCDGAMATPSCGATAPGLVGVGAVHGLIEFPYAVKNPTVEQLNALFDL